MRSTIVEVETLRLSDRLGYAFDDERLELQALTHSSWCAEHAGSESNERLELLGDAVVGLAVAAHLYERFPSMPEGSLAKIRASVVSSSALADVGRRLGIGADLLLSKGEAASGGADKTSILADAVEALIGAVYVDGGWETAASLVVRLLSDDITRSAREPGEQDFKSRLQELVVTEGSDTPRYVIAETGPEHDKRFAAQVMVDGRVRGRGEGTSKKQAEQEAARRAWTSMGER